jgi:hypothetical protein
MPNPHFSHPLPFQFICYGFASLLSGFWLVLWLRLRLQSPDATRKVWSLIAWFIKTGNAFVFLPCSCFQAAWQASLEPLVLYTAKRNFLIGAAALSVEALPLVKNT